LEIFAPTIGEMDVKHTDMAFMPRAWRRRIFYHAYPKVIQKSADYPAYSAAESMSQ